MDLSQPATVGDVQDLYADMAACLMAIRNLLAAKGIATPSEFGEAFLERAVTLRSQGDKRPYLLLAGVPRMPHESDL